MFKPLCFVENFLNSCRSLRCAETAKQNNPEIAEQLLCIIFQVHLVRDEIVHGCVCNPHNYTVIKLFQEIAMLHSPFYKLY